MQTNLAETREIHLEDYLRVLFWNRWIIISFIIVAILVSLLKNDLSTPYYRAEGKLWVQEWNQQAMPFMSKVIMPGLGRAVQLQTFSDIILTRTIVYAAVQELSDEGLLEPLPAHRGKVVMWLSDLLNIPLSEKTEQGNLTIEAWEQRVAKRLMSDWLKVSPSRDSDIITISVRQRTPERARNLVNKIADVFQRYIRADMQSRMRETEKFADQQIPYTKAALEFAEEQLRAFQLKNQTIDLDAETDMIIQNAGQLDLQRMQLAQRLEGAKARLETLTQKLSTVSQKVVSAETLTDNPVVMKLQLDLNTNQIELAALKRQYPGHDNPQIKKLTAQIAQAQAQIASADWQKVSSQTTSLNPIHQELSQQIIETLAEIRQLSNQRQVLEQQILTYDKTIAAWPEKKLQLGRLKRKVVLNQELFSTLEAARQEARIVSVAELGSVKILEEGVLPTHPINPRQRLNIVVGVLVGLILGVGLAFLRDYFDNTYPTLEEALEQLEALPKPPSFLGVVPFITESPDYRVPLSTYDAPKSGVAEAFRLIRTKLQFLNTEMPLKTFLITSATNGEGKSTISSNLVVTLAQMNKSVLLIDADMRRPTQHKTFTEAQLAHSLAELLPAPDTAAESASALAPLESTSAGQRKPGLSDILIGISDANPLEILRSTVKKTELENLDLLTSGTIPPNPVELLNSDAMRKLIEVAEQEYDYVVLDSPPVLAVADPIIISALVDTVILVFNIAETRSYDILGGVESLSDTSTKNVGVLCNMTRPQHSGSYGYGRYGYSRYGFYGRYRYAGYYFHYYSSDEETEDDGEKEE